MKESVLPSWYSTLKAPDGTSLPYLSRTELEKVVFDPSFKNFKRLKSTALWFASIGGNGIPEGLLPARKLNSVEGLENVYTENIESVAGMFASMNVNRDNHTNVDSSPTSLDFST